MSENSSPEWRLRTKLITGWISFFFVVALLWLIRGLFPIVIVSVLVAFILNPLVTFLTRRVFIARANRGARRGLAVVVSFVFAVFVIFILFLIIIPTLVDEVTVFGGRIPGLVQNFEDDLESYLDNPIVIGEEPLMIGGEPLVPLDRIEEATGTRDLGQILQLDAVDLSAAASAFFNSARNLSGPAFSFLGSAFSTLINAIFFVMMTYYLLKDGDRFIEVTVNLVPEDHRGDAWKLLHALSGVWGAYVRGQLILSVVMGLAVYAAALLLGLPNAPILGVLAGLLEFIPNLGPLIALIPAAFLALASQSTTIEFLSGFPFMLVVVFVWTMLQNVEAVFLVPRIMGDSLDLHPIVVIIAVLAGAALAGALGVILAAPFVASGRVVGRYIYGKLTNTDPFPVREEKPDGKPSLFIMKIVQVVRDMIDPVLQKLSRRSVKQTEQLQDAE